MEKVYLDCEDEDRSWTAAFRGQLLACSGEAELYQRADDGRVVLYYPDSKTLFVLDAIQELNHYFDTTEQAQVMRAIIEPPPYEYIWPNNARAGVWQ